MKILKPNYTGNPLCNVTLKVAVAKPVMLFVVLYWAMAGWKLEDLDHPRVQDSSSIPP